ncbi:AB hydrolase superfamily [Lecanosticta acicola]|uniref:AB hydrolase superfamily n=1 Tax=Lecanosticta acicola TaxID=111012 RepID=A0AAI9E7Q4_9PEZI|nr:AB hydrolase superfamily [Lecanosticta acicola]
MAEAQAPEQAQGSEEFGPPKQRKSLIPTIPHHTHREIRKAYVSTSNRPRWVLHMQAVFWRTLMSLGMFFHRLAPPQPPKPSFYKTIDTTISGRPGQITLYFYVPGDYHTQKRLWLDPNGDVDPDEEVENRARRVRQSITGLGDGIRRRRSVRRWGGYPVIINFHGGGFTLGSPHDDARWCGTVVTECNAVVVSVDYRLAPENPFPTAVEDGVDAVVWIHNHAEELGINRDKIALSGFSSGGNMAFTVPLRLHDQQTGFARNESDLDLSKQQDGTAEASTLHAKPSISDDREHTASSSSTEVTQNPDASTAQLVDPNGPSPEPTPSRPHKTGTTFTQRTFDIPEIKIRCIVPWYPSLDYTRTREERRATCVRADQELPALFTDLFDDSYLHPPKDVALDSPYLSPGVAPTELLRDGLPEEIIMHTCEWDMLLDEGEVFYKRLTSDEIGKKVNYTMIPGVPHGWDKAPNPWKPTPGVREHYLKACKELKRILGQREVDESAPRKSIVR